MNLLDDDPPRAPRPKPALKPKTKKKAKPPAAPRKPSLGAPPLPTERIELYARARASGLSQRDAYLTLPGVKVNHSGRIENIPAYENRARELIRRMKAAADGVHASAPARASPSGPGSMSRGEVLTDLRRIAKDKEAKPNDRRAALMDIARIEGHVIERVEHGRPGDFSKLSEAELDAEIVRLAAAVRGSGILIEGERSELPGLLD